MKSSHRDRIREAAVLAFAGILFAAPGLLVVFTEQHIKSLLGVPFVTFGLGLMLAALVRLAGWTRLAKFFFFWSTVLTFVILDVLALAVALPAVVKPLSPSLYDAAMTAQSPGARIVFGLLFVGFALGLAFLAWYLLTHRERPPWHDAE